MKLCMSYVSLAIWFWKSQAKIDIYIEAIYNIHNLRNSFKTFLSLANVICVSFSGENVQNGDHSETQNLSTFSHSSKDVSRQSRDSSNFNLLTLFFLSFTAGCFDRWFTEKRQEEEEGLKDTVVLEEEEGQEEGRSLSSLTNSQQLPNFTPFEHYTMNSVKDFPSFSSAFFQSTIFTLMFSDDA